jgi:GTPase-activating protein BEM2
LDEVGLYRVPGSLSSINALKAALDSGEEVRMDDDRWYDINAIAGCFKSFMRELPAPVIPLEILGHLKTLTGISTEFIVSSAEMLTFE